MALLRRDGPTLVLVLSIVRESVRELIKDEIKSNVYLHRIYVAVEDGVGD